MLKYVDGLKSKILRDSFDHRSIICLFKQRGCRNSGVGFVPPGWKEC